MGVNMVTPENITELKPNEVFVFGSNLAGRHGRGAALTAYTKFGAKQGIGEGLQGQSYAFPTLDEELGRLPEEELVESILAFRECAYHYSHLTFFLTKVGCGLAGFKEEYIRNLISCYPLPGNVIKPEGW